MERGFFVHHKIMSAVKRLEFVSDRMSYIVVKGRWCNINVLNVEAPINVLNVKAPSEEKSDDTKTVL